MKVRLRKKNLQAKYFTGENIPIYGNKSDGNNMTTSCVD